jgi:RND family efflux transporter MFP subunit
MRLPAFFSGLHANLKEPKKRWWIIAPALGVLAAAGGLLYYETQILPSQQTQPATLQTAVARRGDILVSATGTGILQPANKVQLGFGGKTDAKLVTLNVNVSDQVEAGQLLAEVDNSAAKLKYEQARQNLDNLTSASAIAKAEQSLAAAAQNVHSAKLQVEYLISPDVYYWENEIAKDGQAVKDAQTAVDAAPADNTALTKLKRAEDVLDFAKDKHKEAQKNYHDYVLDTFTVNKFNRTTMSIETSLEWPTTADILKARRNVTIAEGTLTDAQNLYAALTGDEVRPDASGSGLIALKQAKLNVQSAKVALDATQIYAPVDGTIMSVSAQLGDNVSSSAIIVMGDLSKLYVQTYMDESDYQAFQVGNAAEIVFNALPKQTLNGKVIEVDPALDTSSRSAVVSGLVQLDPTKTRLLMGMSASVKVIAGQAQNAVLVPLTALQQNAPGSYSVMVLRNGKFSSVDVGVGLKDLVNAEITSGLQPGDVVSTDTLVTK